MRLSGVSGILLAAVVAALVSSGACSSGGGGGGKAGTSGSAGTGAGGSGSAGTGAGAGTSGAAGGAAGASGTTGASGSGAGTAGSSGAAGQAPAGADGGAAGTGVAGTGGMAGSTSNGGASGGAGTGAAGTGAAGTGAAGTGAPAADLTKVAPTAGCGKPAPQALGTPVHGMIMTSGTKDADCADRTTGSSKVCGPWSLQREYFLTLPAGYDSSKPHPLIFEGSACGSVGATWYPLDGNNVGGTAIRVGLATPPNAIGHYTNPGQGCFDDREGDDSIEFAFYETLWDSLAQQLCFDKNRVFAMGYSSGATVANELGCKYAGDAKHPLRAVLPVKGILPPSVPPINTPQLGPTCGTKPMAGMWIWELDVGDPPPISSATAVQRAYLLNGCTMGTHYTNAPREPFPIGGGNADDLCKKVVGCQDQFPLVLCLVQPSGVAGSYPSVANPAFTTFLKMFSAPPLLTP